MIDQLDTQSEKSDLPYWLVLSQRSYCFPSHLIPKTLELFSSLENMWKASEADIQKIGVSERYIKELSIVRNEGSLKEAIKLARMLNDQHINVIKITDEDYPPKLRNIQTALGSPLLIFHKGVQKSFRNCVAIVGTRNCSFRGRATARILAKRLADKGYSVVSGLARGVDEEAHCGALESISLI